MLKILQSPAVISFLLLAAIHSSAATADSTKVKKDSTIVSYFNNDFEKFGNLNLHSLDTTITGYQYYDPILQQRPFYATQGNIGQASRDLVIYPFLTHAGFDYGIHSLTLTCFKTIASNTTGYLKHLPNSAMSKDLRKKPFSRLNLAGTSTGASTWVLTSA